MKKSLSVLISLVVASLLIFSGCDAEKYNHIYDDDKEIAKKSDNALSINVISSGYNNYFSMAGVMTGSKTIWKYDVPEKMETRIKYSLDVSEGGKAKLVHIGPDNEISIIFENASQNSQTGDNVFTLKLSKGMNRIKLVGYDSPKMSVKLEVEAGVITGYDDDDD